MDIADRAPLSRCFFQVDNTDEYKPSRRNKAATAPGCPRQRSVSFNILSLYSAVCLRLLSMADFSSISALVLPSKVNLEIGLEYAVLSTLFSIITTYQSPCFSSLISTWRLSQL